MIYIIAGLGIVLLLALEFFSTAERAAPQSESAPPSGFDVLADLGLTNLASPAPTSTTTTATVSPSGFVQNVFSPSMTMFRASVPPAPITSPTSQTVRIAQAIAQAEGFGIPGAIPTRANNPGDLVLGDVGNGTLGAGITVFTDAQSGWNALYNQVNLILSGLSSVYSPDMTIAQIAAKWTATQQSEWASNVASALGVTPDTVISNA